MTETRILGVILARGGSKGVPRKNLKKFAGVPLIAYTIIEAQRSKLIDRLIVSSEDEEIREVAELYGAEAPFKRPMEFAADNVSSHPAFEHAVEWAEEQEGLKYDFMVDLLCTNPMRTADDIDGALTKLIETGAESVIGVSRLEDHHPIRIKKIENDRIRDFCLPETPGTNRQDLKPDAFIRNGSIYACRRDCIRRRMQTDDSRPYIMPPERSVNIDTPIDAELAELLLRDNPRPYIQNLVPKKKLPAIDYHPPRGVERRVLITQTPIGAADPAVLNFLDDNDVDYTLNPLGNILNADQMTEIMVDFGIVLSGTSSLSKKVLENAPNLRLISRAGIGLDNIDLAEARNRNIFVSYTPDAPTAAVAEFTIGLMLSMTRNIAQADRQIRDGMWKRHSGIRLGESKVGIIGVGRSGKKIIELLSSFGSRILAYDLVPDTSIGDRFGVEWTDLNTIFSECDVVSLHIPYSTSTSGLIGQDQLSLMQSHAVLINTSRGGIVDETALITALSEGAIGGAAMDVFSEEPYTGPLTDIENCILTGHMAAASRDSSRKMELGAAQEIVRFLNGEPLQNLVPSESYP